MRLPRATKSTPRSTGATASSSASRQPSSSWTRSVSARGRSSSTSWFAVCIARTSRRSTSTAARPSADFSRFCADIVFSEGLAKTKTSFAEQLTEHGVETIVPHMAHRPEVLDVGATAPSVCTLVEHERRRRESLFEADAPINHLYPPDKGWVRLDPASQFDTVSLIDLAVLVNDPGEVATILLRLTDDDGDRRRNARDGARTEVHRCHDAVRLARSEACPRHVRQARARGAGARARPPDRAAAADDPPGPARRTRGRQRAARFSRTSIWPSRCACCSSWRPPPPKS